MPSAHNKTCPLALALSYSTNPLACSTCFPTPVSTSHALPISPLCITTKSWNTTSLPTRLSILTHFEANLLQHSNSHCLIGRCTSSVEYHDALHSTTSPRCHARSCTRAQSSTLFSRIRLRRPGSHRHTIRKARCWSVSESQLYGVHRTTLERSNATLQCSKTHGTSKRLWTPCNQGLSV